MIKAGWPEADAKEALGVSFIQEQHLEPWWQPGKPKKSKLATAALVIAGIFIFVGGAGAGYYFFVMDKIKEADTKNNVPEESAFQENESVVEMLLIKEQENASAGEEQKEGFLICAPNAIQTPEELISTISEAGIAGNLDYIKCHFTPEARESYSEFFASPDVSARIGESFYSVEKDKDFLGEDESYERYIGNFQEKGTNYFFNINLVKSSDNAWYVGSF